MNILPWKLVYPDHVKTWMQTVWLLTLCVGAGSGGILAGVYITEHFSGLVLFAFLLVTLYGGFLGWAYYAGVSHTRRALVRGVKAKLTGTPPAATDLLGGILRSPGEREWVEAMADLEAVAAAQAKRLGKPKRLPPGQI